MYMYVYGSFVLSFHLFVLLDVWANQQLNLATSQPKDPPIRHPRKVGKSLHAARPKLHRTSQTTHIHTYTYFYIFFNIFAYFCIFLIFFGFRHFIHMFAIFDVSVETSVKNAVDRSKFHNFLTTGRLLHDHFHFSLFFSFC